MTITEIRDALTQLIDAGHGENRLFDYDNPEFAITDVKTKKDTDENGDSYTWIYFEMDEV